MPSFLARYRTKTKRPVSFKTKTGRRITFKARRTSYRRKRVRF